MADINAPVDDNGPVLPDALPPEPDWDPSKAGYNMDFKGLRVEGTGLNEVPLGSWLEEFERWSFLIDRCDTVLKIGLTQDGQRDDSFDVATLSMRNDYRNRYLLQAFSTRLNQQTWEEVRHLPLASWVFDELKLVRGCIVCGEVVSVRISIRTVNLFLFFR